MHLVVNGSELGRNRGGNETYIAGLLDGLASLYTDIRVTVLTCQWDAAPAVPGEMATVSLGRYRPLPFWLWQQTQVLNDLKPDWYLANYFLPLMRCRGAVVVHDASFRAHPEYYPRLTAWYMHLLTGISMRRAERVITVSEFSRQELARLYPTTRGKTAIVPNAMSDHYRPAATEDEVRRDAETLARYGVVVPFVLALGNIHPRKNLERLLEAYSLARAQDAAVPAMVWVGKQRWGADNLLARARDAGVKITGFVPQEALPAFLRSAQMLVYPSLYEGFGLPPLEAMACGTPVITSNTTSLPGVVGNAALLVDPMSVDAIATAIVRLSRDDELRRDLSAKGLERAGLYSWRRAAEELLSALG